MLRRHFSQVIVWSGWCLLAAGNGPAAGGVRGVPERAVLDGPIVVTQLPAGNARERQPSPAGGMLRAAFGEGARIVLVLPDSSRRLLTGQFHSACDPELSRDGTRMLFAGKRTAEERWHIYELGLDGSNLRQITKGPVDCRSPGYQSTLFTLDSPVPWYQLTFLGTHPGAVNECGSAPLTNLYSCKLDGTDIRQLTFNLSSDMDPVIMPDGRLLYASWQRGTFERGVFGRIGLFAVNIDGFDGERYAAERGRRVQHMPCVTAQGLVVFVEADHVPWDGAGCLSCVRTRRPLQTYQPLTDTADGLFCYPSPLPDGRILVSRRGAEGRATHAVFRFDPAAKVLEPVFDDPAYHELQAKAVWRQPAPDGRSTVVDDTEPHGKLYCLNVYTSDQRIPAGAARRVRVLEGLPARTAAGPAGAGRPPAVPQLAQRRILGEAPVAADGSFHLQVPANLPLQVQLLDADGVALRSCGWMWVKNREPRGCVGCHEDGELTPENVFVTALARPADVLDPPPEKLRAIDFRRDVLPVVTKCLPCHAANHSLPVLELTGKDESPDRPAVPAALRLYEQLLAGAAENGAHPFGKYVHPGRARTSPLVWHVLGKNTSRPWDGDAVRGQAKLIPPGQPGLSADEKQLLIDWIDLGARWDGIPPPESELPRRTRRTLSKDPDAEGM